jgi:formylmethanofuran dehydrogenase subunit E
MYRAAWEAPVMRTAVPVIDDATIERIVEFHGHMCPGLALGIQAARIALRETGRSAEDEQVVAMVETDMCAVDAIQYLLGCTFGRGNLVHRDYGKNAYTFWRRSDGKAVRVSARPDGWRRDPDHQDLFARARLGSLSDEEAERLRELQRVNSQRVLELDPDDLYEVREVRDEPPPKARIVASVTCSDCGEATMETRIRRFSSRELCPQCFEEAVASGF